MASEHNPGNALGTPNKYNGLTSVEGFSTGVMNLFSRGNVSGFEVRASDPASMVVKVGGNNDSDNNLVKDVAIVRNYDTDDRFVVYNKSNAPIELTIPKAPTANSRIDSIVIYRDNTVDGDSDITDNPGSVGLMVVSGDSAATPKAPDDNKIRDALPNGTTTSYNTLANVAVASGVTTITNSNINNNREQVLLSKEAVPVIPADKLPQIPEDKLPVPRVYYATGSGGNPVGITEYVNINYMYPGRYLITGCAQCYTPSGTAINGRIRVDGATPVNGASQVSGELNTWAKTFVANVGSSISLAFNREQGSSTVNVAFYNLTAIRLSN